MAIINNSSSMKSSNLDAGKPASFEFSNPAVAGFASENIAESVVLASCYVAETTSTLLHNFHYRSTRGKGTFNQSITY